jgi:hypothetical protein
MEREDTVKYVIETLHYLPLPLLHTPLPHPTTAEITSVANSNTHLIDYLPAVCLLFFIAYLVAFIIGYRTTTTIKHIYFFMTIFIFTKELWFICGAFPEVSKVGFWISELSEVILCEILILVGMRLVL